MRFGEKLIVFLFRPIYRTFFERLLWWFLTRLKVFFLSEVIASLTDITARLERIERIERRPPDNSGWVPIDDRLKAIETGNAAQWSAMEGLLLAMFRQSEMRNLEADYRTVAPQAVLSNGTEPDRVNVSNNIR